MEQAKHIDWNRVIDRLNQGWGQGNYLDGDGNACLLGAVLLSQGVSFTAYAPLNDDDELALAVEVGRKLLPIIREQYPFGKWGTLGWSAVTAFNDHPDTTLDDVILVVEKARAADGSSWAS